MTCRADGPVWVLRHNVTAINRVTPVPPPPQPPPVMADAAAEEEWLQLAVATHRMLKQRSYDWWMYDCPVERLAVSVGRGCGELQEGAVSKSATFFASENTLPTEHGSPQVGVLLLTGIYCQSRPIHFKAQCVTSYLVWCVRTTLSCWGAGSGWSSCGPRRHMAGNTS
jgi:hypothetical protein